MKLKIYQRGILVALALLIALNIFFIVRSIIIQVNTVNPNTSDFIIFMIALVVLLAILVMDFINTVVSLKKGSTFIRALAYNNDTEKNTRFIVFCYIFGVISIGVIIYFIFVLCGMTEFFTFASYPAIFLIINTFALALVACITIILFPILGKEDISFKVKKK